VRPFRYERARDETAALAAVAAPGARFLGGGTNLVDLMRLGVEAPEVLVDVTRLPLAGIDETPSGALRVGAAVRNSDLAADMRVRIRYPALSRALLSGASGQLRNRATTAGNLLQRTRCPYFQDVTAPCNKREPGSGCSARAGHHRNHAIVGHSDRCVATHPSDMAVAMVAFDAVVHTVSREGARAIRLEDLHRLPGAEPWRDTVLEPGELVVAIELPRPAYGSRSTFRKVRERSSFEFALVSAAAVLYVEGGEIAEARIALGGIAPKPWRARAAEAALRGTPATEASFRRAAEVELEQAQPLRENAYKVDLARATLVRTLLELAQ
jgi:xanthine dehydrogenase YagS FAD-binding subunit